ncbi:transposase [Micromonospora sp. KC606]|uniref:transposase n=1 Tax=Micromonospora sp. KC606 TaxID=2530379 RepID=UPI001FB7EA2C|nr:transposase [Micromonospora sp. KC606]
MTALTGFINSFAALLAPAAGNDNRLNSWITEAKATDLPHLHTFNRGFGLDRAAVNAALTHPFHNGGTEGVNTKTKDVPRPARPFETSAPRACPEAPQAARDAPAR